MNYLTLIFPLVIIFALGYFYYYYYRAMRPKSGTIEWISEQVEGKRFNRPSLHPMVKMDYVVLLVLLIVSSFVSFYKLGDKEANESFYKFSSISDEVILELESPTTIGNIMYYTGIYTGEYKVEYSNDGIYWTEQFTLEQPYSKIFNWLEVEFPEDYTPTETRFIRITADTAPIELGEIAFYDENGDMLGNSDFLNTDEYSELFDERDIVPEYPSYMNSAYFDEIYYARTAYEIINGVNPYEITHPPLGKDIIIVGVNIFGINPFGWRFMGALFGILMLIPLYILIKNMFGKTVIAACGTIIFTFNFMHYVQTRICTIDTYSVFFILLMYLFMFRYISQDYDTPFRKTLPPLILSGISFGLGAAAKWTSIYAGAGLLALYVIHFVMKYKHTREKKEKYLPWCVGTLAISAVFYLFVPAVIYYLSYIPYADAYGYGSGLSVVFKKEYWDMFIDNQTYMYSYHSGLESEHPYSSTWYMWLFDARPILYFRTFFEDGTKSLFAAFDNPIVSWAGLAAIISLVVSFVRKRDSKALIIVIGYLTQLLPWIIISRIAFAYHYFTPMIFITLALCYVLNNMWERKHGKYKIAVYGFTASVVVLFIMFYPVLSGATVSESYAMNFLRWFTSWPL